MTNLKKSKFLKKGVDGFSKKLHFWNHRDVSFQVAYLTCNDAFDPFQRTVWGLGSHTSALALL